MHLLRRSGSTGASAVLAAALLLAVLALTSLEALAQVDIQNPKLDPVLRTAILRQSADGPAAMTARVRLQGAAAESGYEVFIRGAVSAEELQALGVEVRTDLGDIKTAWIPAASLEAVLALPAVRQVQGAVRTEPELDYSVVATGTNLMRGAGPVFAGLNGAGIVVGDVDSGIDWRHDDFKAADGTSRIRYLWDQTDLVGPAPFGFAYGSEWTAADIDALLPRQSDTSGHGTHVMGIAGGDGSATGNGQPAFQYVGMAPLADLVMVKTNFSTSGVVDGVNYVFQKGTALGKPAVCNLSLGSHFGPHDGTSTFEQALSALTGSGKVLVKSGGNEGNSSYHAELFASAIGATARLNLPSASSGANQVVAVDGYYDQLDDLAVSLRTPNGTVVGPVARGGLLVQTVVGQGTVYLENGRTPQNSGDHQVYLELGSSATTILAAGNWDLIFTSVALGSSGEVDLWRFYDGVPGTPRFTLAQQNEELVSEPGNALSVCTVAAFSSKRVWASIDGNSYSFTGAPSVGALATFSSPGPTRDGRQKPDVAAPGTAIVSALSTQASPAPSLPLIVPDGVHTVNQGTSMSAPHVTGAIALLMQNRGPITTEQACQILTSNAVTDGYTGAVPNLSWGYGKLYLSAPVPAMLEAVTIEAVDGAVHLRWTVPAGATFHGAGAERRVQGEAEYQAVTATLTTEQAGEALRFELVDAGVLPGVTYEYRLAGVDELGETVVFGPYVIQVPAPERVWAFAAPGPNPARGAVQLAFTAGWRGRASVSVYDARGRLVAVPLDGEVEAGPHHLIWNGTSAAGSRLPGGLYLVVFRGGDRAQTEKLLLLP